MAKYKKKRARELQHDRFRDTTMGFFDRLGNLLEGRGRTILYGLAGLLVAGLIVVWLVNRSHTKGDEAEQAIGRAITISKASVMPAPVAGSTEPSFATEQERAQSAIAEFEKVAAKYGDPYKSQSQYFIATNRLLLDRPKGISELEGLTKSGVAEVATLSKFALAQAKESDRKLDEAAQLYTDLAKQNSPTVTAETANLRLAKVYIKQGKNKEAADLLFNIVDASRKAKGADNQPIPATAAAREADDELKKLDPDRHAQLPPDTSSLAG
ncbi:MAG TPA: tetratricopeptide repeat protein [Pyrinomonadaceae bacterium]